MKQQRIERRITVQLCQEKDGRWLGAIDEFPGVMAYGKTVELAYVAAIHLCMEVIIDRLEHGEAVTDADDLPTSLDSLSFERELAGC